MVIPLRKKLKRKIEIIIDKIFGYDFLTTVSQEKLGLDPKKYSRCSPSGNKYLANVLNKLEIKESDSIMDIGCGKGSVLNLLIKYPFKNICGIEVSDALHEICKKNMQRLNDKRVIIYNLDARNFEDYQNYNIYYMYNPCSEEILNPIIKKIANKAKSNTQIIYNNPKHEKILYENGFIHTATFDDEWQNGIKIFKLTKK